MSESEVLACWNEETGNLLPVTKLRFDREVHEMSNVWPPQINTDITLDLLQNDRPAPWGTGTVLHLHAIWQRHEEGELWLLCVPDRMPEGLLREAPTCLGIENKWAVQMIWSALA